MQSTENNDDFELEFEQRPVDATSGRRWWRRLASGLVITLAIVLALELAIIGARPSAQPSSSSHLTAVQGSTPFLVPEPTPTLPAIATEPIPASCPSATTSATTTDLGEISYYADPAYGLSPVWMLGLANEQNRHVVHFIDTYPPLDYTDNGWRWRILLVTAPGYSAGLTLSGEETGGDKNATLLMDDGTGPMTKLTLNASQPVMKGVQWAEWPIYVYLPKSGCYQIGAQWHGGNWTIGFAAGA
jgi:hypothetical protein